MLKSKTEKELEKRSSELDTSLLKMKVGWFLTILAVILFYGYIGLILYSDYFDGLFGLLPLSLPTILIMGFSFLLVFVGMFLISRLSYRKLVSYTLYQIAEGLEGGNLNKKYLTLLYRKSAYDIDEIKKEDHLFEKDLLIHQNFKKCLNEFALGLNHAISTDSIDKLDHHLIKKVAVSVYARKSDMFELAGKLPKMYLERRKFPTIYDYFKGLFYNKVMLFIVLELVLIILLLFIQGFFVLDKNTIATGLFTITPGIIYIVFK